MASEIFDILREQTDIFDLFDKMGVPYSTRTAGHKISCPFHGADVRKSAYVYPETNSIFCFTCSESWDVTRFWAQINDWWTKDKEGNDKLDIGKAIVDLKKMYNITIDRPTWQDRFFKLRKGGYGTSGYEKYPVEERVRLGAYQVFRTSLALRGLTKEQRRELAEEILALWDKFDTIDFQQPDWKDHLNEWVDCAKLLVP